MVPVTFREQFTPPPVTVAVGLALIVAAQLVTLAVYLQALHVSPRPFHFYPIIWITVGSWVFWRVRARHEDSRRRRLAAGVAAGYFLVLGYVGGLFGTGFELGGRDAVTGGTAEIMYGFDVVAVVPPGYGPALVYGSPYLTLSLVPYLVVGYLALAYLVYVAFMDAAASAAPGVVGIFGCIGCTWPLLASLVTGAGGATGMIAGTVYSYAYPLSTLAFLVAVGLLYWRPGFGERS